MEITKLNGGQIRAAQQRLKDDVQSLMDSEKVIAARGEVVKIYPNGTPFSDKQWKQWQEGKLAGISDPEYSEAEKNAMTAAEEKKLADEVKY